MPKVWLIALLLVAAVPASGQVSEDPDFVLTDELLAQLAEQDCATVEGYAFRALPYWIVGDDPDSVFGFLNFWEGECGASEPLQRMWILAAIWQGNFDESYYDEDITGFLMERWVDERESRAPLRRSYDDFTVDMADQMLPHQERGGLEEFWCLFYSGRRDEAWRVLEHSDLRDTWLYHYRDNRTATMLKQKEFTVLMLTGGGWWPSGDQDFAGDKPLVGGMVGKRARDWMYRLALEVRVGRTDVPYRVPDRPELGRSDRFDATYLGGEMGRVIPLTERQAVDLFLGVGVDVVVPFHDADVSLVGWNVNVGAGYRCFLGRYREFVLGADVRREWIGERNEDPYGMAGSAWSLRFGVGYAFVKNRHRTLEGLGR